MGPPARVGAAMLFQRLGYTEPPTTRPAIAVLAMADSPNRLFGLVANPAETAVGPSAGNALATAGMAGALTGQPDGAESRPIRAARPEAADTAPPPAEAGGGAAASRPTRRTDS